MPSPFPISPFLVNVGDLESSLRRSNEQTKTKKKEKKYAGKKYTFGSISKDPRKKEERARRHREHTAGREEERRDCEERSRATERKGIPPTDGRMGGAEKHAQYCTRAPVCLPGYFSERMTSALSPAAAGKSELPGNERPSFAVAIAIKRGSETSRWPEGVGARRERTKHFFNDQSSFFFFPSLRVFDTSMPERSERGGESEPTHIFHMFFHAVVHRGQLRQLPLYTKLVYNFFETSFITV